MGRHSRKKVLIIVNPKSGKHREAVFQKRLADILSTQELSGEVYHLAGHQDLAQRVSKATSEQVEAFVVVGGDGTVALIASHLRGKPSPIFIIPGGTTNLLAHVLGVPLNMEDALNLLVSPTETETIDGLEINGRLYFMNASIGLSSSSIKELRQEQKSSLGIFAYVLAVIRRVAKATPRRFSLEIDGKWQQVEAAEVFIANIGAVGMPRYRLADSQFDDGKLEVCVIHKGTPRELLNALLDLLVRRRKRSVHCIARAERITVSCEERLPVQADGDVVAETPVTIEVVPRAATFAIPRR
jgi:YegS/Rv2252/BmrU family lipid kinase